MQPKHTGMTFSMQIDGRSADQDQHKFMGKSALVMLYQ